MTETELIKASQAGNQRAMTNLINLYAEQVHGLIYSIIGTHDLVEDLAQDTFLRMLRSLEKYTFQAPFKAWLFRIAINLCRDYFRRQKVRSIIGRFKIQEDSSEEEFLSDTPTPFQDFASMEKKKLLEKALKNLPADLKEVFILRDIQDFTYEEISETLGWNLGTVKSRLFRARKELATILQPYEDVFR